MQILVGCCVALQLIDYRFRHGGRSAEKIFAPGKIADFGPNELKADATHVATPVGILQSAEHSKIVKLPLPFRPLEQCLMKSQIFDDPRTIEQIQSVAPGFGDIAQHHRYQRSNVNTAGDQNQSFWDYC